MKHKTKLWCDLIIQEDMTAIKILRQTMRKYGQADNHTITSVTCALDAMKAYHAQFEGECEWNYLPTVEQWTSCGVTKGSLSQSLHIIGFTYCPYCGGKIKRVPQGGGK